MIIDVASAIAGYIQIFYKEFIVSEITKGIAQVSFALANGFYFGAT
jgi:hypothetical protein